MRPARLAPLLIEMVDAVHEYLCHVANVDVVPFEVCFEQDQRAIVQGAVHEIIDQQIDSHSGRHTEYRRETKTDAVAASEHRFLGLHFSAAIERDWPQGSVFGAELALFPDAVPAVGDRHHHPLVAAGEL